MDLRNDLITHEYFFIHDSQKIYSLITKPFVFFFIIPQQKSSIFNFRIIFAGKNLLQNYDLIIFLTNALGYILFLEVSQHQWPCSDYSST